MLKGEQNLSIVIHIEGMGYIKPHLKKKMFLAVQPAFLLQTACNMFRTKLFTNSMIEAESKFFFPSDLSKWSI